MVVWLVATATAGLLAQAVAEDATSRPLVLPFAVTVDADVPGGDGAAFWLGEAAALLVAEALEAGGAVPLTRGARIEAFERLQLPRNATLTQATMIRVGELVGATDLVIGEVHLGAELTIRARQIRLESAREVGAGTTSGASSDIYRLARTVVTQLTGRPVAAGDDMPLAAFEPYVKGLVATTPAVQERFLETARTQSAGDSRVLLALWDFYAGEGRHDRALAAASAVSRESRDDRRARYAAAVSLIELHRYDEAYGMLEAMFGEVPSALVSNAIGVIQMRRGSSPQTGLPSYFLSRAVDQAPDHPDFLFNLGYAHARSRETDSAIHWLREAVRHNPADGDAHLVMGQMLAAAGRAVEAGREFELARLLGTSTELPPDGPGERVSAGLERLPVRFEETPRVRVATAVTTPAQREQEELAAFHLGRGRRFFEQGDDRSALAELQRVVYLRPYAEEAHLLLGQLYQRGGRLADAVSAFRIAVWARETATARLRLAGALRDQGDVPGALAEARRALQLEPQSADARALIAALGGGRV